MSKTHRPISSRHLEYVADRTQSDDTFLMELKQAAEDAEIPAIWISPAQASFLEVLFAASRVRRVVEVGTLAGYAAIRMARGTTDDGRVDTIELDPQRAEFAEAWVARSDVAHKVRVHRGDARDVLATFEDGCADAMFIDADKDGYDHYLDEAMRIVRTGGLVLVDNAFAFGELFADDVEPGGSVEKIRKVNDRIAAMPDLRAIIVPFGDGCWVGVKTADPA